MNLIYVLQICSFAHWNDYPLQPKSSTIAYDTDISIERLWNESNDINLRSEPTTCSDVDKLRDICVEMSKRITSGTLSETNDSVCLNEATVETSTACWYSTNPPQSSACLPCPLSPEYSFRLPTLLKRCVRALSQRRDCS